MNFRVLPSQLHGVAEEVIYFFQQDRGISRFRVEEPASADLDYRPTLQATTSEFYDVWGEVSEAPYLSSLDTVVLYCMKNCLPVRLYVAFPAGISSTEYKKGADEARARGVGILEVSPNKCAVIHEALLLSLLGTRSEERSGFPLRYRSVLSTAEATFKNGDPAKGCSLVYDEIESLSRRLAKKVQANNLWTHASSQAPPVFNADKASWGSIMDILISRVNFNSMPSKAKKSLLMRVAALTEVRNESGHKPRNRAARIKRDRELRTRFESAVDVLRDFADAVRPLRI